MPARLALAVIGDEIGPSVTEMLSFCEENDVHRLDMRTVDGRNLLGMTLDEVDAVGRQLKAAGITVPTFVSPVLKWPAPGKAPAGGKVDFAFDPATCPIDDPLMHAFDVATVLGATKIRVFSFLRYDGFRPGDLAAAMDRLVDLADRHDITVEIENEPVCNIGSLGELTGYFAALGEPSPWLRPLVDMIHLKDRDFEAKRTVPLGDGKVPWARELTRLLAHVTVPEVVASMETHCPQDGRHATARSVAALRRIAG